MPTPTQTRIWYDRYTRNWIGQVFDAEGNQIGDAEIAYAKREVELGVAQRWYELTA
jgi:hypothetical protein